MYTFGAWKETYGRWRREGLPDDWRETNFFGEDRTEDTGVCLGSNALSPLCPYYEQTVLEEKQGYQIIRDEHGKTIRRKIKEKDLSIAEYLSFPLQRRSDWPEIKQRLDANIDSRYRHLESAAQRQRRNRNCPVIQRISGAYRILWHLMGDVGLACMFFDDPGLIHEIMEQWLELNRQALKRILKHIEVNIVDIREDMSCNTGMMISPAMFREFIMPYYKQLVADLKGNPSIFGIWVDSDGDVTELIPLVAECGVDGMFPFEVQAGMDAVAVREQYGHFVIRGGIDKRTLAHSKADIDRELERVLPTFVQTGGYFVCLDHSAPPDISLENYMYFLEQVRQYN